MKEVMFKPGDIIKTRYDEIGIVFDVTPLGYYLWAKDFTETGFNPLYDSLKGAVKLDRLIVIPDSCKGYKEKLESVKEEFSDSFWSIEKAREGDIISTGFGVFIFRRLEGDTVFYHCFYSLIGNEFSTSDTGQYIAEYVHPATDEEKVLLLNVIDNHGYKWDSESLKLIKKD